MNASPVYFTDMRCKVGTSLLQKLETLIRRAGLERIDMDQKFVAIKLHFGEPGNLSFLRPNYAKTVADVVQGAGRHAPSSPTATLCMSAAARTPWSIMTAAYENGLRPVVHRLSDHHRRRPEGHG